MVLAGFWYIFHELICNSCRRDARGLVVISPTPPPTCCFAPVGIVYASNDQQVTGSLVLLMLAYQLVGIVYAN